MRVSALALLAALALSAAACRGDFFQQYEYEEEMYLSLDGSATIYVNASVPALNALRGSTFDAAPTAAIDREAIAVWFTTPQTSVVRRPTLSRRNNRRFLHVRLDAEDVKRLAEARPFVWSTYSFGQDNGLYVYRQVVGPPTPSPGAEAFNWDGDEIVAFRIHLPSTIVYHNAGPGNPRRGNILVWEQPLAARLKGEPLAFDARMEAQSILSRTLLLFALTGLAVALMFALILWRVVRSGPKV